jgi:glycosyltransferase involved in cell wall biosynthesis
MASGVAVVATLVGAIPEAVIHEKTGILVPPKNTKKIAEAIIDLLNNNQKRKTMELAAKQRAQELFSLEQMVHCYENVYASVLNGRVKMTSLRPKALVFTNAYPRDFEPNKGLDIKEQVQRLQRDFEIRVIAPVPKKLFKKKGIAIPQKTWVDGIEVFQPQYLTLPKIGVLFCGYTYFLAINKFLMALRKQFPFDLIISYWVYPDGFAAALCAKKFNVPLIIRPRGSDINVWIKHGILRRIIKKTLRKAQKIIPVCNDLKQSIKTLGVKEEKISSVSLGVEHKKFFPMEKDACREKFNLEMNKKIVLFVGNFIEVKGIDYFLKAIEILDNNGRDDIIIQMLGSGKLKNKIESVIRNNGNLSINIQGEIAHNELPIWMNASDVFCLPSLSEGFPNVLMEALACGLPVVATNVGGIPEIINNENLGILVPPRNEKALADAIEAALSREWNKEKLVERVREESWDKIVDKLRQECLSSINGALI